MYRVVRMNAYFLYDLDSKVNGGIPCTKKRARAYHKANKANGWNETIVVKKIDVIASQRFAGVKFRFA